MITGNTRKIIRMCIWCMALTFSAARICPDAHAVPRDADVVIRTLNLQPLPGESGYLAQIGKSSQMMNINGKDVPLQNQVYYLLSKDRPTNYLHWLQPDDTHVIIAGGPVDYYIFCPSRAPEHIVLGRDLRNGQRPVIAVPGGCWKALRLRKGASYALMANILTPAFGPDRVHIGADNAWVARFSGQAPWATAAFLRMLIGPNFSP